MDWAFAANCGYVPLGNLHVLLGIGRIQEQLWNCSRKARLLPAETWVCAWFTVQASGSETSQSRIGCGKGNDLARALLGGAHSLFRSRAFGWDLLPGCGRPSKFALALRVSILPSEYCDCWVKAKRVTCACSQQQPGKGQRGHSGQPPDKMASPEVTAGSNAAFWSKRAHRDRFDNK